MTMTSGKYEITRVLVRTSKQFVRNFPTTPSCHARLHVYLLWYMYEDEHVRLDLILQILWHYSLSELRISMRIAYVHNSSWMPHPVFLKICRFSCSGMKMRIWFQNFDLTIYHGITVVFDQKFPYKNLCPQLLLGTLSDFLKPLQLSMQP